MAGSDVGKVPLTEIIAGSQIVHASPNASNSVTMTRSQNVCYVTLPLSGDNGVLEIPNPSLVPGKWIFIFVEDRVSILDGDVAVQYRMGNGMVDVLAQSEGTADDLTAIYDKLVLWSDGQRYHVVVDVTT